MAELEIKISAKDYASKSVDAVKSKVQDLGNISINTRSKIDTLAHSLQAFSIGLGGLENGFKLFINNTIAINANLEDLHLKLTGLISANSDNITSTGAVINATEKWALSSAKAKEVLDSLTATARSTGISTNDMSSAFSMFYATASNQGSIDKIKQAFESVAYAVKVSGKNMGDLVPMFDSLASGTVVAGSEMGAFMRIIGLTNEELKEANANGNVLDLLIEKTAKFKELSEQSSGGYNTLLGQFKSELNSLTAELGKPIFETFKQGLAGATEFIRANRDMLLNLGQGLGTAVKHLGLFATALITSKTAMSAFNGVIKPAVTLIGTTFTTSLGVATAASKALNMALIGLKTAFKTFLPTALVFGALEGLIAYFGSATNASNALANSVAKTTAQIKQMTAAQLANQINDLQKAKSDLVKERNSQINKAYNKDIMGVVTGGMFRDDTDKVKALANADTALSQIKEVEKEITRLKNAQKGIYENDDKGELIASLKAETKAVATSTKETAKELNAKNRHLINYYEQQNKINEAWKIKEAEQRTEFKNLGFDETQIDKMVQSNKDEYLKRFNKEIEKQSVKSPKISAPKIDTTGADFTSELQKAIQYYEAIGDLRNKELKERELQSLKLKEIGLNDLQIKEYFAKEEIKKEKAKQDELKKLKDDFENSQKSVRDQLYNLGGVEFNEENFALNQTKINEIYNTQLQAMQDYYNQRLELIRQALENENLTKQEYARLENEAQSLRYQQELDAQKLKNDMFIATAGNGLNSLINLVGAINQLSDGKNKTALRAYQALMVGKAIINTYTAASNAYASAGNPYLGAAMAAIAIAQGMAQVAQIKAQKFHTGGFIGGEPLKRDEVPAILQTGEYVLSRKQVTQMQNTNASNTTQAEANVIIINSVDNSVMEQWANSRSGAKIIKNVIKR